MNKSNTGISLNSYMPSLLNGLKNEGINIQRYLKNPFLRKLDLYDSDSYIPNILLEEILVSIKRDLGLVSFYEDLNVHFKSTSMGVYSKHFFQSPNMLTLLSESVKYQNFLRSNYKIKLDILGANAKFSVKIVEAQSIGKKICEEIDILRILDAFKLVFGENFVPLEIGITSSTSQKLEVVLPHRNYNLKLNQEESWLLFKTDLLRTTIPHVLEGGSVPDIVQSDHPETFKVEMLLDSFRVGDIPNLDEISVMFDMSRRTFERKLSREGSSFMAIKEQYLKRKSFELLQDSNASVKEIAEQLNYANSQNYIRSFRRWTGVTPLTYRMSSS